MPNSVENQFPAKAILGLDIGTTSISGVLISEAGELLSSETVTHHAAVEGQPADVSEQSPIAIMNAAVETLRRLAGTAGSHQIVGIGLTGQMHSTVLLDSHLNTIGNVITWQDRRSLRPEPSGNTLLSQLQANATTAAMVNTGCRLSAGYLGTTLYALKELGQWPVETAKVSFVADWMVSQLTGQPPVTDRSHAASSGLFDLVEDRWSPSLLIAANIKGDLLPEVRDSGVAVGILNDALAARTGLPAGIPVCNAIGDNQASVLSCLPDDPQTLLINIGTGGQIVWRSENFLRLDVLDTRYLPADTSAGAGRFMMVGAGLCGGDSLAWVNRTIRKWLNAFGYEWTDEQIWDSLHEQMKAIPTNNGLTCTPFFRGTRQNPALRGTFTGIDNDNFTPAQVAAGVLNGIAQSMFDVYAEAGRHEVYPVQEIVMSGNGARRNPRLVEAVERCFGVPVRVAQHPEEAATGASMLAGSRLGVWPSVTAIRKMMTP
ncbi:MAG: hypothetical protein KDA91_01155 [Planctomycetaceae bacterium]|nr:hypothetical protein [Planctomycetaceae bacterium]